MVSTLCQSQVVQLFLHIIHVHSFCLNIVCFEMLRTWSCVYLRRLSVDTSGDCIPVFNYLFLCSKLHFLVTLCLLSTDQCRSSYQVGFDNSLRITYANGMDTHYQTEPHILAGAANPTVARRNMSLPGESGQNLVEWRFRKEQARGKVIVFGRKLRVGLIWTFSFLPCGTCQWLSAFHACKPDILTTYRFILYIPFKDLVV